MIKCPDKASGCWGSENLSRLQASKDFQQAFAELRTDLDSFTSDEANGLMACGYQMASKALDEQLPKLRNVWKKKADCNWGFKEALDDITSTASTTALRDRRLGALRAGNRVDFFGGSPSKLVRKILHGWRKAKSVDFH
jgi:hypothetical protein